MAEVEKRPRFMGQVISEPSQVAGGWLVMVDVDGSARRAFVPSNLRAVRQDDTVMVVKNPSTWVVDSIVTAHPVPAVGGSMGAKPPAATTVSANPSIPSGTAYKRTATIPWDSEGRLRSPDSAPGSYSQDYGHSVNRAIADLIGRVTALREMVWDCREEILALATSYNATVDRVNELKGGLGSVNSALGSTMSAVNTNASRVNQARDYASTAADAIGGVVDALKAERIVK